MRAETGDLKPRSCYVIMSNIMEQERNQLQETIDRLAGIETSETPTLSMVINLGQQRGKKLATEINSLGQQIRQLLDSWSEDHQPSRDEQALINETEAEGLKLLESAASYKGATGLALYVDLPAEIKIAVPLHSNQESSVVLSRRPHLEPLIRELEEVSGWAVLVIGRDRGSFYLGGPARLESVFDYQTSLRKETTRGDLNSAGNVRRVRQEALDNIREALGEIPEAQHYLLVVPSKLQGDIISLLPDSVAGRVEEVIANENSDMDAQQAQDLFGSFLDDFVAKQRIDALERVERVRNSGRSVSGVDDLLGAVSQRRVQTMILPQGWTQEGYWDRNTQALSSRQEDGWERRFDIVPELKIQVLRAGGEVVYVGAEEEPSAILRY